MKKTISLIIVFILIITAIPFSNITVSAANGVQAKINKVLAVYPTGSYFTANGGTCTYWEMGCTNCNIKYIPARGGLPSGASTGFNGTSCWSFASYVGWYVFGSHFSSWNTTKNPVYGDVIYFTNNGYGSQHYAVYISEDSTNYYVYDSNWDAKCGVSYNHKIKKSGTSATFYHATNYNSVNGESGSICLTLDNSGGTNSISKIYFKAGINKFYSDPNCKNEITKIDIPTRKGYTFQHYYGDGTCGGADGERYIYGASSNTTVDGTFARDLCEDIYDDATLYALWEPNTICLTLDNQGGTNSISKVYFKAGVNKFYSDADCKNEITKIDIPTRKGYVFQHYYGDGTCGGIEGERYIYGASNKWGEGVAGTFADDLCTDIYSDAVLYALWNEHDHVFDNACDTTCNDCGYVRTTTHSYQTVWSKDGTQHWHACSVCGTKKDTASHVYDNSCDTTCNVCGYVRTITHKYQTVWSKDGTQHWHTCSVCGTKKDTAKHVYDNTYDLNCNICGYVRTVKAIFPDVTDTSAWYFAPIEYVSNNNIFSGYSNGYFGLSDNIQRQDFMITLAKYSKESYGAYSGKGKFSDVDSNGYYATAVNWGASKGIVSGYQNGTFGVGDNVTREQLVLFFYRYANYIGANTSVTTNANYWRNKYSDFDSVSDWAQTAVIWALEKGIISGKQGLYIDPQGNAERCQVAVIFYNIDNNHVFG